VFNVNAGVFLNSQKIIRFVKIEFYMLWGKCGTNGTLWQIYTWENSTFLWLLFSHFPIVEPTSWLDVSHVFSSQTKIAVTFEWANLVLWIFSKKSEASVFSVLTGNKEVKIKVTHFGGTYDYCRLHRVDCDVITWRTCKWSVNIFKLAAWGPLGQIGWGPLGHLLHILDEPFQYTKLLN